MDGAGDEVTDSAEVFKSIFTQCNCSLFRRKTVDIAALVELILREERCN